MNSPNSDIDWSAATWEGSRREQLRRWRKRAVEGMNVLSRRLANMPRTTPEKIKK